MRSGMADQRPSKKQKRYIDFNNDIDMAFFSALSASKQLLSVPPAPTRKVNQRISGRAKADVDEFLSSDVERELEMSFASTMSIHSPPMNAIALTPEDEYADYVPMDISPLPPQRVHTSSAKNNLLDVRPKLGRPRAYTSSARLFGRDMSNSGSDMSLNLSAESKSGSGTTSGGKRLQRAALPLEWMTGAGPAGQDENLFAQPQNIPSSPSGSDAMDVDSSFAHIPSSSAPQAPAPLSAAPTITQFNINTEVSSARGPFSAAPTVSTFNQLFYDTMSPERSHRGRGGFGDSPSGFTVDESPIQPFTKKRRSVSPQHGADRSHHLLEDELLLESSPAPFSSPSAHKLERMASGPLLTNYKKPTLSGLGAPLTLNMNNKRPRRPVVSAMIAPGDAPQQFSDSSQGKENTEHHLDRALPPVRRAFSAMLPPSMLEQSLSSEDCSLSFDQDGPDMSSPAQAYAKRQQVKTIRRCDGTDDFRPLTGVTALVHRDNDVVRRGLRRSEERADRPTERDTPRSKYLNAGGLAGFGDNEAHGKILPCHRVREDGLMRISCKTMDDLLDGVYNAQIASFHIIDCRFDYEYNGGHIPGATNINTTAGVEEFLLGTPANKPVPSTSGDASKKTVLVFHCEFSAKRAPTFAKHLRSKDRAMNNHVYPKIHYPEVYILEGGYCQYFKDCGPRCQPCGYVQMDDPHHAASRREDLDHFRKAKFGRTKSYAYGEGKMNLSAQLQQQSKRNTAPSTGGTTALFAAANAARTRRNGMLQTLDEDPSCTHHSDDEDTDIGDSPCPPPNKGVTFKGKKIGRAPLARAETYGPSRMMLGF